MNNHTHRAKLVFEDVIVPKEGMVVVNFDENNPGAVYAISKVFSDGFVDLIRNTLPYASIYSVHTSCIKKIVCKVSEDKENTMRLSKDGVVIDRITKTIPLVESDYEIAMRMKLVNKYTDVQLMEFKCTQGLKRRECKEAHDKKCVCGEFEESVAMIFEPTLNINNIPWEYREELKEIIRKVSNEAYNAGKNRGKEESKIGAHTIFMSSSFNEWFDDNYSDMFKYVEKY